MSLLVGLPIWLGGREGFGCPRFADYRRRVEEQPGPVNVAALVGHMTLRARALSELDRPATAIEIAAMREDLAEALASGALGLSTGLAYPPPRHAPPTEVIALASDVAAAGPLHPTHIRAPPRSDARSLAQVFVRPCQNR